MTYDPTVALRGPVLGSLGRFCCPSSPPSGGYLGILPRIVGRRIPIKKVPPRMSEDELLYSYYCDESCHLENDGMPAMGLGALWIPTARVRQASEGLRAIKAEHGIRQNFEAKWTQVSPAQLGFYEALLNYFFDHEDIRFRAVIVKDKANVQYVEERGGHDGWYYRMYYLLLRSITAPPRHARIYLDIKDSRGGPKAAKLLDVLANTNYDFDHEYLERIQIVRSHEVELLQLTDLLIGAIT